MGRAFESGTGFTVFLAGQILYFNFFKTVILIKFYYNFVNVNIARGPLPPLGLFLSKRLETWNFYCYRNDLILSPWDFINTSSYMYTEQTTCVYNNANELFIICQHGLDRLLLINLMLLLRCGNKNTWQRWVVVCICTCYCIFWLREGILCRPVSGIPTHCCLLM